MAKSINFNELLEKMGDFFKNLPDTIKNAPVDEKAAYGAVGIGFIMLVAGIVLTVIA